MSLANFLPFSAVQTTDQFSNGLTFPPIGLEPYGTYIKGKVGMQLAFSNMGREYQKPAITIAIPTYNRPQSLKRLLTLLLPQLQADTELLVIDNASSTPVTEVIKDLPLANSLALIRIFSNGSNVGGNANVLRCFELAFAPWLWVIGDEEIPVSDAVVRILKDIETHSQCVLIKYDSDVEAEDSPPQLNDVTSNGLSDTVAKMPCFSNFLFISSSVFQRSLLVQHLAKAYSYCWAFCPHIAMVLIHLRLVGGNCMFSPVRLVKNGTGTEGGHWDGSHVSVKLFELLSLLPLRADRHLLALKMRLSRGNFGVSVKSLLLLAATGNFEMLDRLLTDEMAYYRNERAANAQTSVHSVIKIITNELISRTRRPIFLFAKLIGFWRRHPGMPGTDSTSKFLGDSRI